jgi:hypothetical protein
MKRLCLKYSLLVALALAAALSLPAEGEDRRRFIPMATGTTVCDSIEQLIKAVEEQNQYSDGCGLTKHPLFTEVTPQTVFAHDDREYNFVRYEILLPASDGSIEMWTQFGYWGLPRPIEQLGKSM